MCKPELSRLTDEFENMLYTADQETLNMQIEHETGMAEDFIRLLNSVKNAPSRHAGDTIINRNLFGDHARFSIELADIMEALDRETGNEIIDELIRGMNTYIAILNDVKNASTRTQQNAILAEMITVTAA